MAKSIRGDMTLWDYEAARASALIDGANGVGPFEEPGNVVHRHLGCANYDACLSFAAARPWSSFGCLGCRKTSGGAFLPAEQERGVK